MNEPEVKAFATPQEFNQWLAKHYDRQEGIWLRFFKKGSNVPTVTYAEALDEALCFGWIDAQVKKYDEQSYIQKFTPRRAKSIWSKRNVNHIARLEKERRMRPSGLAAVEAAKADGRWDRAYDSPETMTVPDDLLHALAKNKKAEIFFKSLGKANVYAIVWRLQTAPSPEARAKRMTAIIDMLAKGETFH